jgi:predicted phage-related endonuclease
MGDPQPTLALAVDQQRDTSCLGASEAPGVLGLDPRNPPIKIWRRHRGLDVDDRSPSRLVEAADWGHVLEPIIRGKYALRNNLTVLVTVLSYVLNGWLRCTPDGVVMVVTHTVGVSEVDTWPLTNDPSVVTRPGGLVQCKNVDAHLAHEWQGGPPPRYEIQARVELAVTKLPWCDLVALIGGNKYVQYRVERDVAIEARILRDLRAFWALVQSGVEPTVDHTDAWRLHVSEKMPATKMVVDATPEDVEAMLALKARRTERDAAVAAEKLARNEVLLRMAQRGVTGLRSEDIGTVSAYRTRGTWALRCPPQWGDDE